MSCQGGVCGRSTHAHINLSINKNLGFESEKGGNCR